MSKVSVFNIFDPLNISMQPIQKSDHGDYLINTNFGPPCNINISSTENPINRIKTDKIHISCMARWDKEHPD